VDFVSPNRTPDTLAKSIRAETETNPAKNPVEISTQGTQLELRQRNCALYIDSATKKSPYKPQYLIRLLWNFVLATFLIKLAPLPLGLPLTICCKVTSLSTQETVVFLSGGKHNLQIIPQQTSYFIRYKMTFKDDNLKKLTSTIIGCKT
jgi:hypothetical protein